MFWDFTPPQRSHMMDQLETTQYESFPTTVNMEMLYIVLVVTLVDPSITRREMTQDACAGTLISSHLVITSASCLIHTSQEHPDPSDTGVLVRKDGARLRAIKIYIHPSFVIAEDDYNIAAIEVEGNHAVTDFPKMPAESLDFENIKSNCTLAGYGKIATFGRSHFNTVKLDSSIVHEFECRIKSDQRFCLHFNNLLPCNGDVGSPLICNGELYAIFSPNTVIYPQICLERYGTAFVKVYSVRDWLDRILNVPQVSMEWMNNPLYILLLCGTVLAVIGGIYYLIMEWLQKTFEPLATETVNEAEGDDDINSEWTKPN